MARIPPEQLPQPIYPGQPGPAPAPAPGAAGAAAGYAPGGAGPGPGGPGGPGGPAKKPPTALIAGIAGAVVVVIVIVVVLVLTLGGDKKTDPAKTTVPGKTPTSAAPGGNGGGGGSQAKTAANNLVGQVPMPGGEYQCVLDALDGNFALASAVVSGTSDPTEVANLLVSCVSANTIADAVTKDLAGQYPPGWIACYHSNIASMDESSLTELLTATLSGDGQSAQTILSYAAVGC
ncbi:MAG: hypothetical protein U0U69_12820 [Acidimicrobiia bacterium]